MHRHESQSVPGRGVSRVPPLLPLSIVFCLCFSDLVGQGTIFINYAKLVFRWSPATLGWVVLRTKMECTGMDDDDVAAVPRRGGATADTYIPLRVPAHANQSTNQPGTTSL